MKPRFLKMLLVVILDCRKWGFHGPRYLGPVQRFVSGEWSAQTGILCSTLETPTQLMHSAAIWGEWSVQSDPERPVCADVSSAGPLASVPKLQLWQRHPTRLQLLPPRPERPPPDQEWVRLQGCRVSSASILHCAASFEPRAFYM